MMSSQDNRAQSDPLLGVRLTAVSSPGLGLGKSKKRKSILPLLQKSAASERWKSANANHRAHTHLIISIKHVEQFSISIRALFVRNRKEGGLGKQFAELGTTTAVGENACEMKMSWPEARDQQRTANRKKR